MNDLMTTPRYQNQDNGCFVNVKISEYTICFDLFFQRKDNNIEQLLQLRN